MVDQESILVLLVQRIDRLPTPPSAQGRGRPVVYSERLFLKALVIMIVKHLATVGALLAALEEPRLQPVRALLTEDGRYPHRRPFERRLAGLPERLPAQIACLGQHLLGLLDPFAHAGRAVAIASTPLAAHGGVWHQKHRDAGVVPHTSIDTEAHWTKSGWHGWVYDWKLHLITTVAAVWIPLAAALTAANVADNEQAPRLVAALPPQVRFVLGDQHYNDPALQELCAGQGLVLVTTQRGPYPHTDAGVEVRRVFHKLRSAAIETFNGQFKAIFDGRGQVPTKGRVATRRFMLGAVLVYHLPLLLRHERGEDLRVGLKAFLDDA